VRGAISLISDPAEKARSEPVRTTAWISGWDSNSRRAALSSLIRGVLRALSALRRLSVTACELVCGPCGGKLGIIADLGQLLVGVL